MKPLEDEMERLKVCIVADMGGSWSASCEDTAGSYTVTMKPSRRISILKEDLLRLKTADPMVPEDARDRYKFADHLIRFVAEGYDLPWTDAIKMELDGEWVNGKHGPQFQVDSWCELVPPTICQRHLKMSFSAGQHTSVYSLNYQPTCRLEARQVLIYQCILDLTGKNHKYNYSKAVHFYPPFSYILCSVKNYKIASALIQKERHNFISVPVQPSRGFLPMVNL